MPNALHLPVNTYLKRLSDFLKMFSFCPGESPALEWKREVRCLPRRPLVTSRAIFNLRHCNGNAAFSSSSDSFTPQCYLLRIDIRISNGRQICSCAVLDDASATTSDPPRLSSLFLRVMCGGRPLKTCPLVGQMLCIRGDFFNEDLFDLSTFTATELFGYLVNRFIT